ncbi:unnamed protein product [Porites evermanni]|uniref:Uncharacterized protein n=1 Tax=Porites evermanni TaxID=104178 RepID=A0ABN8SPF2_9CNID|nr:unnamed protein product [Porites evermanni]
MALLIFLSSMVTISVVAFSSAEESCLKLNTCVCMFSNKSIVDLWPVDGSSKPSFTQIPEAEGRVFDWNPCTPFTTDVSGCNNVTSCQIVDVQNYPAGIANTTFSVNSEGNVVIIYGASKSHSDKTGRQTEITLRCDPDKPGKGTIPSLTGTIHPSGHVLYNGTFTSKFACAFPTHQTLPGDPVQQKDEVIN